MQFYECRNRLFRYNYKHIYSSEKEYKFQTKKKSAEMQAGHNTVQQILNNISQNV